MWLHFAVLQFFFFFAEFILWPLKNNLNDFILHLHPHFFHHPGFTTKGVRFFFFLNGEYFSHDTVLKIVSDLPFYPVILFGFSFSPSPSAAPLSVLWETSALLPPSRWSRSSTRLDSAAHQTVSLSIKWCHRKKRYHSRSPMNVTSGSITE